jgi:hypothetical protein
LGVAKRADTSGNSSRPSSHPDPRRYEFEIFLYEPTQITTRGELHLKRRAEEALSENVRNTIVELERAKERLQRVQGALQSSPDDKSLQKLCNERQAVHASEAQRLETLDRETTEIREQARRQKAYI